MKTINQETKKEPKAPFLQQENKLLGQLTFNKLKK